MEHCSIQDAPPTSKLQSLRTQIGECGEYWHFSDRMPIQCSFLYHQQRYAARDSGDEHQSGEHFLSTVVVQKANPIFDACSVALRRGIESNFPVEIHISTIEARSHS
jgi:hypothetical protein